MNTLYTTLKDPAVSALLTATFPGLSLKQCAVTIHDSNTSTSKAGTTLRSNATAVVWAPRDTIANAPAVERTTESQLQRKRKQMETKTYRTAIIRESKDAPIITLVLRKDRTEGYRWHDTGFGETSITGRTIAVAIAAARYAWRDWQFALMPTHKA